MVKFFQKDKPNTTIPKKRQLVLPMVLVVIGLIMNICGKLAMESAGLPIYLDTMGTIIVSMLGGFVPGILVALLTNLLSGFIVVTNIYYDPINILIALITVLATRHGWLKSFWRHLLFIFILACIGGGIGGLIYWYLNDVPVTYYRVPMNYLMSYGYTKFWAFYTVHFGYDFLDKVVTVNVANMILFLLPKKHWDKFKIKLWKQAPLSEEEEYEMTTRHTKGITLNKKLFILLISYSVVLAVICTIICYWLFIRYAIEQHTNLAVGVAKVAASTVDAESIELYLEEGKDFESYQQTQVMLNTLQNKTPDVEYVYVYKITSDGCVVIFDVDNETDTKFNLGDVVSFDPGLMDYIPLLLSGNRIDPIISNDQFGWLLTAYEPVYDSFGDCVCYAGVDIKMEGLREYELDFLFKQGCIFSGFLIFFLAVSLTIVKYHILLPIDSMAEAATNATYEDIDKRRESQKQLAQLDIRTGDEIENLYRGLLQTAEMGVKYYTAHQRRAEELEKMQFTLVSVLVDLIENRDRQAEGHSQKIAEYVMSIATMMSKMGYYGDVWSADFIKNLGISAPLHDIGKMSVPESILNKEGELTEEEFEIMKTHTTSGARIIENAINKMPDMDYLDEACDMAYSHHEWWNGSGYPLGIAGEEIPLSARIMAVVDTFDALITDKNYKKAVSVEEAFITIEAASGTQFDPLVVDAFLRIKDEITNIAEGKK